MTQVQFLNAVQLVSFFKKNRSKDYLSEAIRDTDLADDQALLVNTPDLAGSLYYKEFGFKYSYRIQIICTQLCGFKYSCLIQIICTQLYGFKYSWQIQIIFTQLYDIKYLRIFLLVMDFQTACIICFWIFVSGLPSSKIYLLPMLYRFLIEKMVVTSSGSLWHWKYGVDSSAYIIFCFLGMRCWPLTLRLRITLVNKKKKRLKSYRGTKHLLR